MNFYPMDGRRLMMSAKPKHQICLVVFITAALSSCGFIDNMCLILGGPPPDSATDPVYFNAPDILTIKLNETVVTHEVIILRPEKGGVDPKPVLLLHELPGLTPKTLDFGNYLKSRNFTVYIPILFGKANQNSFFSGTWNYFTNGEWRSTYDISIQYRYHDQTQTEEIRGATVLIHQWLRALVKQIEVENPKRSIGVIGMCLTGAVPLALLDNPHITRVVLAQPTLPVMFWGTEHDKRALALSDVEHEIARKRGKTGVVGVLGIRFRDDLISKSEKFESVEEIFHKNFQLREMTDYRYRVNDTSDEMVRIRPTAHSTLVGEWIKGHANHPSNTMREEVVEFLQHNIN